MYLYDHLKRYKIPVKVRYSLIVEALDNLE